MSTMGLVLGVGECPTSGVGLFHLVFRVAGGQVRGG